MSMTATTPTNKTRNLLLAVTAVILSVAIFFGFQTTASSVSFAGAKQTVNQACLIEGESWTVQAKFKLMSGTDPVGCDRRWQ